ncbi:hypothetical protein [Methylomagnum ishizawai]|uniref:hypothetical protein n=1 Tax=Methylomagnum ishizawai TaxID=1760988 RepID=UPI001C33B14F|nr:hypothetical protein [Methylomagnum ishizawai]BBL74398.1 hypothetical protein MishRS11D_14960 [Methylomagnum ishizawai]
MSDTAPSPERAGHRPAMVEPQEPAPFQANHPPKARFHFFLIDSGWDCAAAKVIRDNLDMILQFQNDDPLFVLTREQSTDLIRRNPHFIGKDPILLARDLNAVNQAGRPEYHGFHLNLGVIKHPSKALAALQEFLAFLAIHRQSPNIEVDIREKLHRDGIKGAIEVIRTGTEIMIQPN